jgi:hypothetical protein
VEVALQSIAALPNLAINYTLPGSSSRGKKTKTLLKIFYVLWKMAVKPFLIEYWPGVEREV